MDFWQSGGGVGGHGSAVVWLHADAHTHTQNNFAYEHNLLGGKKTDRQKD